MYITVHAREKKQSGEALVYFIWRERYFKSKLCFTHTLTLPVFTKICPWIISLKVNIMLCQDPAARQRDLFPVELGALRYMLITYYVPCRRISTIDILQHLCDASTLLNFTVIVKFYVQEKNPNTNIMRTLIVLQYYMHIPKTKKIRRVSIKTVVKNSLTLLIIFISNTVKVPSRYQSFLFSLCTVPKTGSCLFLENSWVGLQHENVILRMKNASEETVCKC